MKKEADFQRVLAQERHIVEGYPMVVTRCTKYDKPAQTVSRNVDDVGTSVDIDDFEGGGESGDAVTGDKFVGEDAKTPQLDKESSV